MTRHQLLQRLDEAWADFKASYAGLSESQMMQPGLTGDWSVKDIIAHVTTWEEEALKYLPLILEGGRPPRYARYGGIEAFNAEMTKQKRALSLPDVLRQCCATHRRLVEVVRSAPEEQIARATRFRRRLRLDTYGHYPEHAETIRRWRQATGGRADGPA
jgi:Mycothiol maleylpyruvate isomerase N-terminal domain